MIKNKNEACFCNIMNSKIIGIIFLLLLIPFIYCVDFDGDGIDDGPQNLCGDQFCQQGESASCPVDCDGVSEGSPSSSFVPNTNGTDNPSAIGSVKATSSIGDTFGNFFQSTSFKIILIVFVLLIIGFVIFLLIKKKKNPETPVPAETTSIPPLSGSQMPSNPPQENLGNIPSLDGVSSDTNSQ
jgi:hypothetical protein